MYLFECFPSKAVVLLFGFEYVSTGWESFGLKLRALYWPFYFDLGKIAYSVVRRELRVIGTLMRPSHTLRNLTVLHRQARQAFQ